jgi:hypothetical protein
MDSYCFFKEYRIRLITDTVQLGKHITIFRVKVLFHVRVEEYRLTQHVFQKLWYLSTQTQGVT